MIYGMLWNNPNYTGECGERSVCRGVSQDLRSRPRSGKAAARAGAVCGWRNPGNSPTLALAIQQTQTEPKPQPPLPS